MFKKTIFILLCAMGLANWASSQNTTAELIKNSDIYYFKNSGLQVDIKDSADYIRVISPPDSTDLNLFVVREFYLNGKPRLIGKSLIPSVYLKQQGTFVEFYPNGRRKSIENYENGIRQGDGIHYFPNGKLYYIATYNRDTVQTLNESRDTSGVVMAKDGNGTWIQYTDNFQSVAAKGPIVNGKKEGEWQGVVWDSVKYTCMFKNGRGTYGKSIEPSGKEHPFTQLEVVPSYVGGMKNFYTFLAKNIRYPKVAKDNNIQGMVFVTFFIEKDGRLANIKIFRGIGAGCDEEAVRIISMSPPWIPGYLYGMRARIQFNIPISFALQQEGQ